MRDFKKIREIRHQLNDMTDVLKNLERTLSKQTLEAEHLVKAYHKKLHSLDEPTNR